MDCTIILLNLNQEFGTDCFGLVLVVLVLIVLVENKAVTQGKNKLPNE